MAEINPIRYRGYYYDDETGLYYLQSRYYDAEIGRFINADDTAYLGAASGTLSYNLFAYCGNEPINYSDCCGHIRQPRYFKDIVDNYYFIEKQFERNKKKYDAKSNLHVIFEDNYDLIGTTGSYSELRKLTYGTGLEVHHLIEARFFSIFSDIYGSVRSMPAVILSHEEHLVYTNIWRHEYPYGNNMASQERILEFVYRIYGSDHHDDWLSAIFE